MYSLVMAVPYMVLLTGGIWELLALECGCVRASPSSQVSLTPSLPTVGTVILHILNDDHGVQGIDRVGPSREVREGEGGSGEGVRRTRGGRIEVVTKNRGWSVDTVTMGNLRWHQLI